MGVAGVQTCALPISLPLAYPEGFTRHPQLQLAAPLPVGATAEGELMDVFLAEPLPPATFAARLEPQTPPELTVQGVDEVPLTWPSLQSLVREWTWRAQLPPGTDPATARHQADDFLARETFPWEQQRVK